MCWFLDSIFYFLSPFLSYSPVFVVSLVAQTVKNLPAMQETGVLYLGQEDPLREEMTTHSSILAWKIPWTEEPGRLQFMGSRVRHNWVTNTFTVSYFCRAYPSVTYWEKVMQYIFWGPYMSENVFILLQSWLLWVILWILSEDFL